MQSGFEAQIRNELRSEIDTLDKNYALIKDVLSGAEYDISDITGTLQSFKDNLSKVNSLFAVIAGIKSLKFWLPIEPLIQAIDSALLLMDMSPQTKPSSIIQLAFALSNTKIESVMALISILKKTV